MTSTLIDAIDQNAFAAETARLAAEHALTVNRVTWEDTSRTKNSCWGPNISDMTLRVAGRNLPVVRAPNFADTTWDVPMRDVQLVVGNERAGDAPRTRVPLDEYLRTALPANLYAAERDSHVIASAQSCYLPVASGGGGEAAATEFNVALFNYQSRADDPAVLVLVGSASGTSAQTVGDARGGNELHFNDAGRRCAFTAERLKEERARRGVALEGAMNADEAQRNCLVIVQVPLLPQRRPTRDVKCCASFDNGNLEAQSCALSFGAPTASAPMSKRMRGGGDWRGFAAPRDDTDHAMLGVSKAKGEFPALPRVLVRDARYPVRVTLQYYKATSNGVISAESMSAVAAQLRDARGAFRASSLVTDGDTGRPTESTTANKTMEGATWSPFSTATVATV